MSRTIQFKRRQASEIANTVGANGEIIIDITNNVLTVHDGVTPGGHALPNEAYVDEKIADLVDGAPGLLDTLKELADAINDDPNFFSNVQSSITTANTNMKLYVDGQIANVSGNTGGATQLAQAAYNQGNSTAIVANTGVDLAQSAFSTANTKANTADLANVAFTGSYNDLTNVPEGYSNSNVALYLANYDGTINFTASPAIISGVGTLSTYEVITGTINNPDGNVTLTANDGVIAHTWSFEADGGLRTPNNQLTIGGYTILTNNNNEIDLGNGDDITIRSNTGNVSIGTDWDNQQRNWTFGEYGRLYFPGIEESEYTIGETEGGIELSSSHGAYISTNTSTVAHSWSFQQDGDLYIPGVIRYSNGVNILDNVGVTGNIFIASACSAINFVANSSGDGFGLSTIQLVPDTNATQDQYIVIDPTAPSHIHIRAGGVQDSSGAQLFLGGEKQYVRVTDNQGVRLQNEETNDIYNYYSNTVQYVSGTWYEEGGNYFIQFTSDNSQMVTDLSNFASGSPNEIILYWDTGTEVVSNTMICPTNFWQGIGNVYTAQVNLTLPANNTVLTAIEFHLFTTQTNYVGLENNDFTVDVNDDIRMYARDVFSLRNYAVDEPISIITDYNANSWTWSFDVDGELRVPGAVNFQQNSTIPLGPPVINGTNDRVRLWDFNGSGSGYNYAIGTEPNHVWFTMDVNNGTGGFKFYSRDNQVFKIRDDGALIFADSTTQNTAYPGPQDLSSYATLTDLSNSNTWLQQYTNTVVSAANTDMKIYVDASVSALINSAPATLDTLKELADALGDDSNFANTVLTIVGTKANTAELSNVAFSGSYNDLTNLPPVNQIFDTSNGAYNQANSANSLAQAAFNYANTIISDTGIDQFARDTANTASNNIVVLQGVNNTQNTNITNTNNLAQNAYNKANSANVLAQAAFDAANTGASNVDQFARDTANSANILAQAAFNQANTGSGTQTYANSNVVSLLSSFGSNNITTTGNISTGKITTTGNTSNGIGAIVAGVTNTLLPNTTTSFSANVNNYTQVTFQNKSSGTDATADFILTADNGNDTTNFGDFGIINSGYDNNTPTNSLGNIVFAADTYLYAQGNVNNTSQSGGNLVIGTATTGKAVKVFAGGNNANALVATITGGSVTVTGNITASGTITTNNIIGTSANVTITANSYVSTFDTLGKLTLPGEVVMPNRTAFRVYGANTTGSLSTTQNGTGILNYNNWAVDYQQGNSLNVVSGLFTAPANGLYQICVNGRNAGNTTSISQLTCYRNNANVLTMLEFGANSSMNHAGTSTVAKLNTGDTLNIKVTAGTITFDGNDSWSVTYLG